MKVDHTNTPTVDQLVDVIGNSSVGIAVTDTSGAVVLHNKALSVLMGGEADHLGKRLLVDGREDGTARLLERLKETGRIDNVAVTFRGPDGDAHRDARVNAVLTGERVHWVSRPELGERLPVSNTTPEDLSSDAATWIRAVDEREQPSLAPTAEQAEVMAEFYRVAPVAIHLIGLNGEVMYANPADVALVEYTDSPNEYVGNHIRRIYEDQGLLDDFLSRWDEDSPIINFRANFVTKEGAPRPVLIFSTAQAQDGNVNNTRCFVFNDPEPQRERDTVSAFGWPA
ncbi:PAS domain-containing protein [Streptomyces sp. OF3]|uniref:PAS domain-containing protein n=1 Tax=Streptomyces alkaliterrae TaxID=2213162 RepID=A0A7W3ZM98_9ACTN|nr:PAS domain-containing protein [Streptomyces alkaliterrae]MBB1253315.1 PAS domain-containing protein [Streptomyces alkaliterrae]